MESQNAQILLRKRSSLKRKSTLKDANMDSNFNFNQDQSFKRKITWNIDEEQNTDLESALNKSSDRSYDSAKTHYSDVAADETEDLYLKKLHEINGIEPTKEIIEEIVELAENNEEADSEKGALSKLIHDTENLDLNKSSEDTHNIIADQSPENSFKRKRSLRDEFELIKSAVQKNEDELSTEVIAETMKNTLYNRVIGKLANETE